MKHMIDWIGVNFQSSSGLTEQFSEFARDFKRYIKQQLYPNQYIAGWSRGHFYVSGFVRCIYKQGDRFVYFSVSDVRHFPGDWWNHVLIRTAKNDKDYTGGTNYDCRLDEFGYRTLRLGEEEQ